jgi:hypothetical protein
LDQEKSGSPVAESGNAQMLGEKSDIENEFPVSDQGCQMVSFQTKNPNLSKFWRAFAW